MPYIPLVKIGTGIVHVTSSGRKCIKMEIDPSKLVAIPHRDLHNIYVFKNDKNRDEPPYTVMAKVDSSGEPQEELHLLDKDLRAAYFAEWIFSPEGQETLEEAKKGVKKVKKYVKEKKEKLPF